MDNHPREDALALYSTADLDERELTSIAEHVRSCAECRLSVGQFQQIAAMLPGVAGEPSPGDLLDVRQRVMRALERTRKQRIRWQWAPAVAALVALFVLLSHKERPMAEIHPIAARVATVHATLPAQKAVPIVRRRRRLGAPGLRSIALVMRPGEEPVIEIATSDPKVVILLPPTQNNEGTESNDD
jgi:hypothetical protein